MPSSLSGENGSINIESVQYPFSKWEIIRPDERTLHGSAIMQGSTSSLEDLIGHTGDGIFRKNDGSVYCGEVVINGFREDKGRISFKGASDLSECTP